MLNVRHKRHPPIGSRPGTLVVPDNADPLRIRVSQFDESSLDERDVTDVDDLRALVHPERVTWIDIRGFGDEATLRRLGDLFGIHPLALEDVVNAPQRPKIEEYGEHLLLVARGLSLQPTGAVEHDQISLFVGRRLLLSFQERETGCLDPVLARLREAKGPIRSSGPDYLAYALLDTIIDGYYPVIQELVDGLALIEERIMERPTQRSLHHLNALKSALAALHRAIVPQREALTHLLREGNPFVSDKVLVYLRDTADHTAQLADLVDSNRDMANGLVNTYLSLLGARTNEVMKVLTIMASIFIPLTFLAGIYGMNFEAMPELHARWGYPTVLVLMVSCAIGMLLFFRRKGWLGSDESD